MKVLVVLSVLLSGCAGIPDRLDALADAGRDFTVVHPALTGAALIAARAALHKPQHVAVMCDPRCRFGGNSAVQVYDRSGRGAPEP